MADQELIAFSQDLRLREYAKGHIVFEQGDLGHTLSIILTGKIRVFRLTPSGLETTLTILGTGDLVEANLPSLTSSPARRRRVQ